MSIVCSKYTAVDYIGSSHDPPAGTAWLPIAKLRREVVKYGVLSHCLPDVEGTRAVQLTSTCNPALSAAAQTPQCQVTQNNFAWRAQTCSTRTKPWLAPVDC